MIWPYDERGRMIGEDVWEYDDARSAISSSSHPSDVLDRPSEAGELLEPLIKPLPAVRRMMNIGTGFTDANGAKIYYEVAGGGPPLVFVHGYALDRRMWDDQFEIFAPRYRVVRYDLRGFGRSGVPTAAPFSNHDDLRRLFDVLGIERAHICGLSMGGGVTIDFALEYPDRVRLGHRHRLRASVASMSTSAR